MERRSYIRSCEPLNPDCPLAPRCRQNRHHLFYPESDYKTRMERTFRDLPENKVWMCTNEHNELHYETEAPSKPTFQYMLEAINKPNE